MARPLVSVLIANYNFGPYIGDAIDSALAQTYPHTEVVVVDDGSTDESREIIAGYGDRVRSIYQPNRGWAVAHNTAFAASNGEIICMLDSDDRFLPEKVARVVEAFQSHDEIGSCFHPLRPVDATGAPLPISWRKLPPGEHDFRKAVRRGRMPFLATATSGLTFRRRLYERLLPLPSRLTGDHYLKFGALGLQKTLFLDALLAEQRIHSANEYTGRESRAHHARFRLMAASALVQGVPELRRAADHLFGSGVGILLRTGEARAIDRRLIRAYLERSSTRHKLEIAARALYRFVRS